MSQTGINNIDGQKVAVERPRRLGQWVKRLLIAAGTVVTLDAAIVIGFSLIRPPVSQADAVIVLGAKVGTPALTERARQGLKFPTDSKSSTLVLSGGQGPGEPTTEAQAMEQVVMDQIGRTGGKPPRIILETTSTDTFENIRNAKKLIPEAKSTVIVSDTFHLARAVIIAHRAGFETVYWDAPVPSYYTPADLAFYYAREVIGMIAYIPKFITN